MMNVQVVSKSEKESSSPDSIWRSAGKIRDAGRHLKKEVYIASSEKLTLANSRWKDVLLSLHGVKQITSIVIFQNYRFFKVYLF